jgi:hypothetical protein
VRLLTGNTDADLLEEIGQAGYPHGVSVGKSRVLRRWLAHVSASKDVVKRQHLTGCARFLTAI